MQLRNATTGELLARRVSKRAPWFLGNIRFHEGVWVDDAFCIHTLGMRSEIDVVFLDAEQRVIRTMCSVPRNRFPIICLGARAVVGLVRGALHNFDVLVGDRFLLEE